MTLTSRYPGTRRESGGLRRPLTFRGIALALLALACSAWSAPLLAAEAWEPTKPIRLILPYAPGGSTDLIARIVAVPLAKELGQQIVIDNRGGGGGLIAMSLVARAQPDGYTLG